MSQKNVQFSLAAYIVAVLGYHHGSSVTTAVLADSVRADATFVRRSVAKLARAGVIATTRGQHGACRLVRPPTEVTLLEVYRASEAPPPFALHAYAEEPLCSVSANFKLSMCELLVDTKARFESGLAELTVADLVGRIRVIETTYGANSINASRTVLGTNNVRQTL